MHTKTDSDVAAFSAAECAQLLPLATITHGELLLEGCRLSSRQRQALFQMALDGHATPHRLAHASGVPLSEARMALTQVAENHPCWVESTRAATGATTSAWLSQAGRESVRRFLHHADQ